MLHGKSTFGQELNRQISAGVLLGKHRVSQMSQWHRLRDRTQISGDRNAPGLHLPHNRLAARQRLDENGMANSVRHGIRDDNRKDA